MRIVDRARLIHTLESWQERRGRILGALLGLNRGNRRQELWGNHRSEIYDIFPCDATTVAVAPKHTSRRPCASQRSLTFPVVMPRNGITSSISASAKRIVTALSYQSGQPATSAEKT